MSMKLYYCPACARVYFLTEGSFYLCGRNHAPSVWPDGKMRRFYISEKSETNRPPWPVPTMAEERELSRQELSETWLDECKYPDDRDYGNYRRHFGYGAPGARHLTKENVLEKYSKYVLNPAESDAVEFHLAPRQVIEVQTSRVKDLIPFGTN
jgi:hypothetical protein